MGLGSKTHQNASPSQHKLDLRKCTEAHYCLLRSIDPKKIIENKCGLKKMSEMLFVTPKNVQYAWLQQLIDLL